MTLKRMIAICAALALLALPAVSLANHHEDDAEHTEHGNAKAGGKAAEHRSESAEDHSNAQWDEDNEGKPEKLRDADDEDGDDADDDADSDAGKSKKEEKDKKGKQDKGQKSSD